MDAISLLTNEHKELKSLLSQLEETSDKAIKIREKLFEEFKQLIVRHEKMEEEIFYPALKKKNAETKDKILEAVEEHHVADNILEELENLSCGDEKWIAKLTVLRENLEHHIKEEEDDLFPTAEKTFDKAILQQLAKDMQQVGEQA